MREGQKIWHSLYGIAASIRKTAILINIRTVACHFHR